MSRQVADRSNGFARHCSTTNRDLPTQIFRLLVFCTALLSSVSALAQSGMLIQTGQTSNDEVAVPKPGGHDYQHFLAETVNMTNGSVSYRIQYPMPKGRSLTLPYWYPYNSAGLYRLEYQLPEQNIVFLPNYLVPPAGSVTWSESTFQVPPPQCGQNCIPPPPFSLCNFATNFNFTDMGGGSHNLALGVSASNGGINPGGNPAPCPAGDVAVPQANDGQVWGIATNPQAWVTAAQNWNACNTCDPQATGPVGAFTVTDKEGNTYFFSGVGTYNSGNRVMVAYPSKIEDRNGNLISNGLDTLGRSTVTTNGSGQLVIGGITYPNPTAPPGAPAGTTVSYNSSGSNAFTTGWGEVVDCPQNNPGTSMHVSGTQPSWSGLALPDGTQYTFFYGQFNPNDSTLLNSYGLVNEVTFPNGGWIKYKWAMSTNYSEMGTFSGLGETSKTAHPACFTQYTTPVLTWRQVSYDGVTVAQTQTFAYTTAWPANWASNPGDWTAKTTTVQTTDNPIGKTAQTVYSYAPGAPAGGSFSSSGGVAAQIPLEVSVQYYDWGNTSSPVKTVTKSWFNESQMACELTTIGGQTSGHFYQWNANYGQISDDKEYDFGVITNPTTACSGAAPAGFTRETVTTFQSFTNSVGAVFGKPLTVVTKNSGGAAAAETDYAFDGSSLTTASAVQHDAVYGTGMTSRGNPTSVTKKCLGCTDSKTTLTYDITGQILSVTDPCGNGACGDVSGTSHTTQYSYADSPSGGNAAGPSNAYLSQVTYPQTGSTTHTESFAYNYTFGDLTSSTDQNGRVTNYKYVDPMDRLTETDNPDGGKTTLTYTAESAVTTSQSLTSSLNKTSVAHLDGMFHVSQTQLTSDPDGTDTVDTTYDGMGNAWKVSNPHRSGSLSTDGTAQTGRDALGRPTQVTDQDGSIVTTQYEQPCVNLPHTDGTTVTDESGHIRRTCVDGLGRLVEVDEPGSSSPATPGSGSVTISGSEQGPVNVCPPNNCPTYDTGSLTVSVNGSSIGGAGFGQHDTSSTIASNLNTAINNNPSSPVSASLSGANITLTSKTSGSQTNYSLSVTMSHNTTFFPNPSFTITPSGSALTGGTDSLSLSPFVTLYNYDILGNLTCVEQHGSATGQTGCSSNPSNDPTSQWRIRRFTYDSLSRLLSATNPESGAITYTYDLNSNVASKTAPTPNKIPADPGSPQSITTNYSYDDENRVTQKSYTDGVTVAVKYGYDGVAPTGCTTNPPTLSDTNPKGRLTSMCDGSGATTWALDIIANTGWKSTEARTINGTTAITKNIVSQKNLGGTLTSLTYPSGRIVNVTVGGAGRDLQAQDSNGTYYARNASYAPFGGLTGMTSDAAPITTANTYNSRLQPIILSAGTTSTSILSLTYDFHLGSGNNGNVFGITNNRDNNRTQAFSYDYLNRIASAQSRATTGSKCWGDNYTVDPWGNLTNKTSNRTGTGCVAESLNAPATLKNQISGYCYDIAGNLLGTSACPSLPYTGTYVYDAENRIVSTAGVTYTYDGQGNRVKKSNGTLYWGSGLGESDLSATSTSWKEYVFFNGERIARRDASNSTVHYYFSDRLNTTDVVSSSTGTIQNDSDYYPYGGEMVIASGDTNHFKFTGKERDSETGLDYFGARHYSSAFGRFIVPDWAEKPTDVPYATFGNPQSLNLYAYVENNPTTLDDPDGHADCSGVENWLACHAPQVAAAVADAENAVSGTVGKLSAEADKLKTDVKNGVQEAKQGLDAFNGTVGFAPSHCAAGGDCINAIGMAGTAIVADMASDGLAAEGSGARKASQLHHIASDKAIVSGFTREFEQIFAKAGKNLQWDENLMQVEGHLGRHSGSYNKWVLEKLTNATRDLAGDDAAKALTKTLRAIRTEIEKNPGILKGEGI